MFMKRKIKSVKGFTLAELLIVVAIIAVLVAIGIPIFTSHLEKSREAVDLSDVRSAYAEVMMAAITGDTTAIYTKDANQMIYKQEANVYSITVNPLKQKQDGWQTAESITIGGVSSKAGEPYWEGLPGADGYCIVTYHPPVGNSAEYVSFYWAGGTKGDSGSNGTGDSGGNNGSGETTAPSEPGQDNGGNFGGENGNFVASAIPYPDYAFESITGNIYSYNDKLYICTYGDTVEHWWRGKNPESAGYQYTLYDPNQPILTEKDKEDNSHGSGHMVLKYVNRGDIYTDGTDYYVCINYSSDLSTPPENTTGWAKINFNSKTNYPE